MNSLTESLIVQILTNEMGLDSNHIWVRNQNRKIPSNQDLYVIVGLSVASPQSSETYLKDVTVDSTTTTYEVNRVQMREDIQIDILSRNNDSLTRRWEIVAAMKSIFSTQLQEANSFKIFSLPISFINSSDAEGGSTLNRFTITIPTFVWYMKEKISGNYYDYFETRIDDEETIATENGLIDFVISAPNAGPDFFLFVDGDQFQFADGDNFIFYN